VASPVFPDAFADFRAQTQDNKNFALVGSWIRNIRPSLINEFRYNHGNRYNAVKAAGTGSGENGKLNIGGVDPDRFPRINVTGLSSLGSGAQQRDQTPILTEQALDTVTWVKGRHQIKTGFEFRYSRNQDINTPTTGGLFAFNDRATASGLAALLLGYVNNATLTSTDPLNSRSDFYGAFIQDNWKISSRLTINLGLRWDMDSPRFERDNHQSGFDPAPINPVAGAPGIITFSGVNGRSKYAHDFDKNNFGPRFGFAWRIGGGMVVRGGYGIYYNTSVYQALVSQMSQQSPLSTTLSDSILRGPLTLANGFPVQVVKPFTNFAVDPNFALGYLQSW
jgi:hypothetical protein